LERRMAPVKTRLASVGLWLALEAETTWVARTKVSAESFSLPTRAAEADLGKSVSSSRWGLVMIELSSSRTMSSFASTKNFNRSARVLSLVTLTMGLEVLICSSIDWASYLKPEGWRSIDILLLCIC